MEGGTGENFTEKRRVATGVSNRETRIWPGGKLSRLPGAESSIERVRKGAATGAVSAKGVAEGERRTGRAQGSGDEVGPASEHANLGSRCFVRGWSGFQFTGRQPVPPVDTRAVGGCRLLPARRLATNWRRSRGPA